MAVTETLADAAEELGSDVPERLRRFAAAAASDETYQELLARTLTIAQDTSMRDTRRALGRALDDNGSKVDNEIAFVRMLADLDPVHIRVLKIMSRRPKHLDQVAKQMNATDELKAARQWYEWSILHAGPASRGANTTSPQVSGWFVGFSAIATGTPLGTALITVTGYQMLLMAMVIALAAGCVLTLPEQRRAPGQSWVPAGAAPWAAGTESRDRSEEGF